MTRPEDPPTHRRLLFGFLGLLALFGIGRFLESPPDFDAFFGLEAGKALDGWPAILLGLAALLLFLVPGAAARVAREASRAAPTSRMGIPALLLVLGLAFSLLPSHRHSGDVFDILFRVVAGEAYPSNALTSWLMIGADRLIGHGALIGIRIVGIASGIVYALASIGIARSLFPDAARRAVLVALLLTAGSTTLFYGTLEVYATLVAGISVYLFVGIRHLHGVGRTPWPPLVLGVTFCLHGSAGLLLPSLLLLANDGSLRPVRVRRICGWGLLFLVPVVLTFAGIWFFVWGGEVPPPDFRRYGTFLGGMDQGPILPLVRSLGNLLHRYAILDAEHLVGVANLLLLAAPTGLLLLFAARVRPKDRVFRWLAVVALFLVLFPVFWNVNFALRRDQDLFLAMGVPLTLLGGLAFLRRPVTEATMVRVVAVALFAFVPLVLANHGGRYAHMSFLRSAGAALERVAKVEKERPMERVRSEGLRMQQEADRLDRDRVKERVGRAYRAARRDEAASLLESVRLDAPRDPVIANDLAILYFMLGRREEGRRLLDVSIRLSPERLKPYLDKATLQREESTTEEAIRTLRTGIRLCATDHRYVDDALTLLRTLYLSMDDERRAETVREIRDQRRANMAR